MKISLITVCYNAAATIRDTLDSALAQQVDFELEYIVQDGGSTDGTLGILAQYPNLLIASEPDKGLYNALNKALARATGDVVAILHADDIYPNANALQSVAEAFTTHPTASAVYGDLLYVDRADTSKVVRTWYSGPYKRGNFLYGWMPPHPAFFLKREAYHKFGGFNETLTSAADYELMLRMLYKHRLEAVYIPKTLVKMRVGGKSNATLANRLHANREDRKAWTLNGLRPLPGTLWLKPLRKLGQFFRR